MLEPRNKNKHNFQVINYAYRPLAPLLVGCCFGILPIIHEIGILDGMNTDWNQASEGGHASFCLTAGFGYAATVEVPLENGAHPDIRLQHRDRTPLLWAAFNGHPNVMRVLLDEKVDVNAKDRYNRTALQFSVKHRCDAAISTLLDRGADVNAGDNDGKTPLSWAAWSAHGINVQVLLDWGANADPQDKDGKPPLSWAAWNGHDTAVKIMLNKGADVNSRKNDKQTPLS